jgi:FtsP/CotA-like multicopper oxidase with cupredoxin domain
MRLMKSQALLGHLLRAMPIALAGLVAGVAQAAVPGLDGTVSASFSLSASAAAISQPDGASVYSWGYGCQVAPSKFLPRPGGTGLTGASCGAMQIPGPTLIVTQGAAVTVTLTNNLPAAAGNTSILFPGFNVTATPVAGCASTATTGTLTIEAPHGCSVTYTFTASTPGTHAYYSGTQGDLQVEMGLYGAIIVLPATIPAACTTGIAGAAFRISTEATRITTNCAKA